MAKATYAKKLPFHPCFLCSKSKKKKGCDVMPYPFLLFVTIVRGLCTLSAGLCRTVACVENLLLQNLVTFDGVDVCPVTSVLVELGVVLVRSTK